MDKLLARDSLVLAESILKSCENKAAVVSADEKEGGLRATLNLGHTFGHAIENGIGYGAWLHGEAVSCGIDMAARLSLRQGWITTELCSRIHNLLNRAKLPTQLFNSFTELELGSKEHKSRLDNLSSDRFLDLMSMDKKVADGQLNLVLLKGDLGNCVITNKFDPTLLKDVVGEYCAQPTQCANAVVK